MAHVGLITLNAFGHLFPMSSLAVSLRERGHRVTFFCFEDSEAYLREAGLQYVSFGSERFGLGYTKRVFGELGRLSGQKGVDFTVTMLTAETGVQLEELPDAIAKAGVDVLAIDQFLMGGSTVAERLQLPYVHVANALLANVEVSVPPINFGWSDGRSLFALARNRMSHTLIRRMFRPIRSRLNETRRAWNLPLYTEFFNERFGAQPQICQEPPSFEFERRELPPHFHFVGPLHSPVSRPEILFPWVKLDERPLLYASMGTLQNGLAWVFRVIAEACAGLEAQLVLSLGGNADPEQFAGLPGDPIVVKFAPQLRLLQRATLCITHAGLNTALESLACGVPMVAIPVTNDQPAVAARIVRCGAGESVPLKKLTAKRLRAGVIKVMSAPAYRESASKMQREIQQLNSLVRASQIVEDVLVSRLV